MIKYIVLRIEEHLGEFTYKVKVIAHSFGVDFMESTFDKTNAEIYYINFVILDENQQLVNGNVYLTELLNESPLKVKLVEEIKAEVDQIILIK